VRQARLEAGLSLAQVAGDDVSRTFILFVEQGRARPSSTVLRLIARRTGKPTAFFLRDPRPSDMRNSDLADELIRLAGHIRRYAATSRLTAAEVEGMRLLESALQKGAQFVRAVERRTGQRALRPRTRQDIAKAG
jgi:transcriptional regulator with XRE-family HTH domain